MCMCVCMSVYAYVCVCVCLYVCGVKAAHSQENEATHESGRVAIDSRDAQMSKGLKHTELQLALQQCNHKRRRQQRARWAGSAFEPHGVKGG